MTSAQFNRGLRLRLAQQLHEAAPAGEPRGVAVYTLSDPRDIRNFRYVGQTAAPRRRFLQHLSAARLWLPDERPWWIKNPRLRPLYEWIRGLHAEDERLPAMVVWRWTESTSQARVAEREWITECLARDLPLLNVEAGRKTDQYQLL